MCEILFKSPGLYIDNKCHILYGHCEGIFFFSNIQACISIISVIFFTDIVYIGAAIMFSVSFLIAGCLLVVGGAIRRCLEPLMLPELCNC